MDVSVVAAVGSFAVSEKVLKPKASVLVILGGVLAWDLCTKTNDISALRVYRGPALIAFTLMMAAWSLRTWRRNGVACDELLFLPGTRHGQRVNGSDDSVQESSEGDAAAGPPPRGMDGACSLDSTSQEVTPMLQDTSHDEPRTPTIEMTKVGEEVSSPPRVRLTSVDDESLNHKETVTSIASSTNDDDHFWNDEEAIDDSENNTSMEGDAGLFQRARRTIDEDNNGNMNTASSGMQRFQENHPRIVRMGSLFFFRSSNTTVQNATYAPSGPSVFGAGLDMSMPILINFHLFIISYNHIDENDPTTEFTAKILPLIFLTILIVRTVVPPGRRRRFWSTMRFTMMAPFYKVRFRDAFIGDVLTSLVRPFQDVLFALSYYATVVYGTVVSSYGIAEAQQILEQSWVLHNVILPSCAMLPLWWRFLQEIRAAFDDGQRWPHYGNAFKYLSAAMIILYGMTHPEGRRSTWWIVSFLAAVLYQIWWDTIMEWKLFVVTPRVSEANASEVLMTSWRPDNKILMTLHMHVTQPIYECFRRRIATIPTSLDHIQLRPQRLYKTRLFYIRCFVINACLRFLWMLCFIPAYRLDTARSGGMEKMSTFSSDVNSYVGVLLSAAEILRRAIWGFFKLEMETIQMMEEHRKVEEQEYSRLHNLSINQTDDVDDGDDTNSKEDNNDNSSKHGFSKKGPIIALPFWMDTPHHHLHNQNSSHEIRSCNWTLVRRKLFEAELCLWMIAFVG
eukprot:CAMPEP_0194245968 /NCGR_PEP_ID=MMETSP0158-20130606/14208_1 /TAXON_ID=33649 /ORGANISM="Thalassionema nitzschioides, Strain L26-B" /LENGTH=733 /DNA_ID=CAMNT_0038981769 /DNA_START=297 /DNA_END=2494 /DNA_ORIENTATION=-